MSAISRFRSWLGLETRAPLPTGYQLDAGVVVSSSLTREAPRRGTRELLQAYRESPRLRAVASRIARGVASLQVRAYSRVEASQGRATFGQRRDAGGIYRDVSTAPAFAWGQDRAVRDMGLVSGPPRLRAARRRELAALGQLREVVDHPILELMSQPNPDMSGRTALYLTQLWLDLKGEAFWLLTLGPDGRPTQFWPVPPHWVQSTPTNAEPYFMVSGGGSQLRVRSDAVVWFRDPDPEDPYGRGSGIAESLGDELETDEFAAKYLKNFFFNSAMPSAVVAFEGANEAALKAMKERWEQEHRGFSNAHRVHFGAGKMNAVRLDASLRDQQMTELREFSRDMVAQVFSVPPEMVGIIENSNRSTIDAATYIYALGVEFPRAEFIRDELQRQLAPKYDAALVLEVEVPIPDDESRRLDVLRAMPGAFSLNEWRSEAGYEPLPQFDGVHPPIAMPGQEPPSAEPPAPTTEQTPPTV